MWIQFLLIMRLFTLKMSTILLMVISQVYCAKKFQFVALNRCLTANTFIIIEKCEIDDIYITMNANLTNPIAKVVVCDLLICQILFFFSKNLNFIFSSLQHSFTFFKAINHFKLMIFRKLIGVQFSGTVEFLIIFFGKSSCPGLEGT